jgi:methionine-rich copper-binding protein CopC
MCSIRRKIAAALVLVLAALVAFAPSAWAMHAKVYRNTIQRGSTANVHAAAGTITTNVTISGVPALDQVVEKLTGFTSSVNDFYSAQIKATSITNLEVKTRANAAMTITVEWEVVISDGKVQRGEVTITSSSSAEAVANTTITDVGDTARAKVYANGAHPAAALGYSLRERQYLTTSTNLRTTLSRVNNVQSTTCPYVIESY